MHTYIIKSGILIFSLALPVGIGTYRYRILDKGTKIFYALSILSLVTECLGNYMAVRYKNNLLVYNISSIVEVFLVSLYFNYTISSFRKRNLGWVIGFISVTIGIANNFFIQTVYSITHYFLFYQALITIILSFAYLSTFLNPDDTREVKKEVHFWFPLVLIFSWSATYLLFTLISFYSVKLKTVAPAVILALFLISILTNLSIAAIFFFYPKMRTNV